MVTGHASLLWLVKYRSHQIHCLIGTTSFRMCFQYVKQHKELIGGEPIATSLISQLKTSAIMSLIKDTILLTTIRIMPNQLKECGAK